MSSEFNDSKWGVFFAPDAYADASNLSATLDTTGFDKLEVRLFVGTGTATGVLRLFETDTDSAAATTMGVNGTLSGVTVSATSVYGIDVDLRQKKKSIVARMDPSGNVDAAVVYRLSSGDTNPPTDTGLKALRSV